MAREKMNHVKFTGYIREDQVAELRRRQYLEGNDKSFMLREALDQYFKENPVDE